jgi:hypothetical protein
MMFLKSGMWTLAHEMKKVNDNDGVTAEAPIFFYSFEFESKNSLFGWIFISDNDIPIEGGILIHNKPVTYLQNAFLGHIRSDLKFKLIVCQELENFGIRKGIYVYVSNLLLTLLPLH